MSSMIGTPSSTLYSNKAASRRDSCFDAVQVEEAQQKDCTQDGERPLVAPGLGHVDGATRSSGRDSATRSSNASRDSSDLSSISHATHSSGGLTCASSEVLYPQPENLHQSPSLKGTRRYSLAGLAVAVSSEQPASDSLFTRRNSIISGMSLMSAPTFNGSPPAAISMPSEKRVLRASTTHSRTESAAPLSTTLTSRRPVKKRNLATNAATLIIGKAEECSGSSEADVDEGHTTTTQSAKRKPKTRSTKVSGCTLRHIQVHIR